MAPEMGGPAGPFDEAPTKTDLRREITGLERTAINGYSSMLQAVVKYVDGTSIHPYFKQGLIQSYERVLDALMYGYPAAVFDGWPEVSVDTMHTDHDHTAADGADGRDGHAS